MTTEKGTFNEGYARYIFILTLSLLILVLICGGASANPILFFGTTASIWTMFILNLPVNLGIVMAFIHFEWRSGSGPGRDIMRLAALRRTCGITAAASMVNAVLIAVPGSLLLHGPVDRMPGLIAMAVGFAIYLGLMFIFYQWVCDVNDWRSSGRALLGQIWLLGGLMTLSGAAGWYALESWTSKNAWTLVALSGGIVALELLALNRPFMKGRKARDILGAPGARTTAAVLAGLVILFAGPVTHPMFPQGLGVGQTVAYEEYTTVRGGETQSTEAAGYTAENCETIQEVHALKGAFFSIALKLGWTDEAPVNSSYVNQPDRFRLALLMPWGERLPAPDSLESPLYLNHSDPKGRTMGDSLTVIVRMEEAGDQTDGSRIVPDIGNGWVLNITYEAIYWSPTTVNRTRLVSAHITFVDAFGMAWLMAVALLPDRLVRRLDPGAAPYDHKYFGKVY